MPSKSDEELPLTMSIPAAGRYFYDFNRGQSYRAAEHGALVVVPVGPKLKRVSVSATMRLIE